MMARWMDSQNHPSDKRIYIRYIKIILPTIDYQTCYQKQQHQASVILKKVTMMIRSINIDQFQTHPYPSPLFSVKMKKSPSLTKISSSYSSLV